jgi:hypothetical protein
LSTPKPCPWCARPAMSKDDRLDLGYEERAGFMVGKAAALADWSFRKDEKAFARLVNSLRVRKWQRENPEKSRAKARRWWAKHREEALAKQRERSRRAPRQQTCDVCQKPFALPYPHPRGSVPKRCSDECRREATNRQARKDQAKKRRATGQAVSSCTVCGRPGHNRRTCKEKR